MININQQGKIQDQKYFFKNKEDLQKKIQIMIRQGSEELQLVSDFDWTVTSFKNHEGLKKTTMNFFTFSEEISQDFKDKNDSLFAKYHPIEIDPNIPEDEKLKYINEWYSHCQKLYTDEKLTRTKCLKILDHAKFQFRFGYQEFVQKLAQQDIPYYLISGGVKQFIQAMTQSTFQKANLKNFEIYGNDFIFEDDQLKVIKINVTPMNKNQILNKSYRKNNILMGDLITDCRMEQNMNVENSIRIGFLDQEKEYLLDEYVKYFDIVILGDGSFDLVNYLLDKVSGSNEKNDFFDHLIF